MKVLFSVLGTVGSLPMYVLLFVFLFFFGRSWFFLPLFLMLVLVSVVVYCVKWWFPARRPEKIRRSLPLRRTLWNHWRFVDRSSFPSAHTAYAAGLFMLSVMMGSWLARAVSFLFLCVMGWSRFSSREHYWRDILAGLVLGLIMGLLAWYWTPLFISWF